MPVNEYLFTFISENAPTLANEILTRQYELQPELKKQYTLEQHNKCIQDIIYHLSYLAEALLVDNIALFSDYMVWAKVLLNNLKIPTEHLYVNLQCIGEILSQKIPEYSHIFNPYIEAGIKKLEAPFSDHSYITEENPYKDIAQEYLKLLLATDRVSASALIMQAVKNNINIKDIYIYIFEPVLKEVGRLWQTHKITVAQEHYCTASTQLIMAQLYPYIFSANKNGFSLVAACVNNELHEVGIRMVADILEMDGWNTYYLGANVPKQDIIEFVLEKNPLVVALSCTMTYHLHKIIEIIKELRQITYATPRILVGGYPFNIDQNLWKKVGADLYAPNATETSSLLQKTFF